VLRDLVVRIGWQLGIGLVIGHGLGIPFARSLSCALPSIETGDGPVIASRLVVPIEATFLAVIVPARRALRVGPMIALRHE
jgi:hypothetical protein